MVGKPETGLEEINRDLLEADFWPDMTSGLPVRTKPLVRRRESSGVADEE
jgi:hypothetical protein